MNDKKALLQKEYQERFESIENYRKEVWKILCHDFFARYISKESTILDLGAGWGEFSKNIIADHKYAMDLNPDCGIQVQDHAEFLQQDCSTSWPLSDDILDIVFTSNFLEHLPNKESVDLTLAQAFRCLKKGGKIICLGPNIKYLPGTYWDYWDHYVPISDTSLCEALTLQNFEIIESIDRFLPYTMSGGSTPPLFFVKMYLKLRFTWPLFGKQFFIVAQKP